MTSLPARVEAYQPLSSEAGRKWRQVHPAISLVAATLAAALPSVVIAQNAPTCAVLERALGPVWWDTIHEYAGEYTFLFTDSTRTDRASFRVLLTMNDPAARMAVEVNASPVESPLRGVVFASPDAVTRAFGFRPRSVEMIGRTMRLGDVQTQAIPGEPAPGPSMDLTLDRGGRLGFIGRWAPVLEGTFAGDAQLARRGGTFCAIRKEALQEARIAPDSMSRAIIDVVFTALVQQMAGTVVTAGDTLAWAVKVMYPEWGDQAHWARRTREFLSQINGRERKPDDRGEFFITIETPRVAGSRLNVLITLGRVGYCNGKPWSSWSTGYAMYSSVEYLGRLARPVMVTLANSDLIPREECKP